MFIRIFNCYFFKDKKCFKIGFSFFVVYFNKIKLWFVIKILFVVVYGKDGFGFIWFDIVIVIELKFGFCCKNVFKFWCYVYFYWF